MKAENRSSFHEDWTMLEEIAESEGHRGRNASAFGGSARPMGVGKDVDYIVDDSTYTGWPAGTRRPSRACSVFPEHGKTLVKALMYGARVPNLLVDRIDHN